TDSVLNGVSCPTKTSCYAVGQYLAPSSFQKTLVERWDGTSWSIMPSPNPTGTADNILNGVSCPSLTSCFAVGTYTDAPKACAEHWNGTSWSIVNSPTPPGTTNSFLSGVSCPSTTRCYAVGYFAGSSMAGTLVERWN